MGETSKRASQRSAEKWFDKYLVGEGIDIGSGDDPVSPEARQWDIKDGDAQYLHGVEDGSFDWVYSSHCLEHMVDPAVALSNWWRVLRPGGHLIVMVPDEDLYEQAVWPSVNNTDHKSTWSIFKTETWSPVHHSLAQELAQLPKAQIVSLRLYDTEYDYTLHQKVGAKLLIDPQKAKKIEEQGYLAAEDMQGWDPMRLLGFSIVDQTSPPFHAEVSIEGIAKKYAN